VKNGINEKELKNIDGEGVMAGKHITLPITLRLHPFKRTD
jgi:hypothetical protein